MLTYWEEVLRWSRAINLVSARTAACSIDRHLGDSAQIVPLLFDRPLRLVDLGSGGGLPAVPIALIRSAWGYRDQIVLIESDRRKAVFLQQTCRHFGIPATVLSMRAEAVAPLRADVITARAMSTVARLLPLILRHGHPNAVGLLLKGRRFEDELDEAREAWTFDVRVFPSATSPDGVVLGIANVEGR